jgi:hypothetical protein
MLGRGFGWRVTQVDWLANKQFSCSTIGPLHFPAPNPLHNNLRISSGVVFDFGK